MAVRGLGKGLDSLIPNTIGESKKKDISNQNSMINERPDSYVKITKVEPNREQPRKNFDEDALLELSESIKQFGLLQPILVQDRDTYYEIIAGERRWRAAKLAGLKEVPVIIRKYTEQEIVEISLIENIQRQDLNPIEEALAYLKLISEFELTQEELSKRIGKSRVAISNIMRLINLDERVQQYLIDGVLSEGHGRALLRIPYKDVQYKVAQIAIDEKLSVRDLENKVKNMLIAQQDSTMNFKTEEKELNPYYKDVRNKLQDYFGTKVSLSNKKNKGKIEIEYYSEEDLQRILDIMNI